MDAHLRPRAELSPAVRGTILRWQMLGIAGVIAMFALALTSVMGYLPHWVFLPALWMEPVLGWYVIRRLRALRG